MYSEKVMDHFSNPRNVGEIPDANGVGTVGNAKCGDIMKMYLKVENGVIVDVKFKTFGCGAAIATSSMATEMVKGKTLEEALKLTNKAVADALDGFSLAMRGAVCRKYMEILRASGKAVWQKWRRSTIAPSSLMNLRRAIS